MLENAPQEEELHTANNDDKQGFTPEYIESVAQETLELVTEKCADPLVHKVMAMMIIHRMIEWHNTLLNGSLKRKPQIMAACWYRDAGSSSQ